MTSSTSASPVVSSPALRDISLGRERMVVVTYVLLALLTAVLIRTPSSTAPMLVALILFCTTLFASRQELRIGSLGITGELVPLVVAACVIPHLAPIVAIATFASDCETLVARTLNACTLIVSVAIAGAVALVATDAPLFLMAGLATLTFLTCNVVLVGTFMVVRHRTTWDEYLPMAFSSLIASTIFVLPIIAAVVVLFQWGGVPTLAGIIPPLLLVQHFHGLYHRKVQLTDELAEKAMILARTNLQFAAAMVRALDARDSYTAGHSAAVAVYTRDIARELGFDNEMVRQAHIAGLLHDIGKIGVPGRVLNKTAPLDDDEYEMMKQHAAIGSDILAEVDLYEDVSVLVRHHHERIDGRGYPDQLEGEFIPAISRIISVADTYSAMTTDRPYRDGMPTAKAMSILEECRGTQLDADFTATFLRILAKSDEDYQRGKQTDFEVEVAKHQALSGVEAEAIRVSAPAPASPSIRPAAAQAASHEHDEPVVKIDVEALDAAALEREAA